MTTKKQKRTVFQASLSDEEMDRLQKLAKYKGQKMSALFRNWVNVSFTRLPEDAK
jgi:hypothetical protein